MKSSLKNLFRKLPGYTSMRKIYRREKLKGKKTEEVFTYIYQQNIWGNPESVSGAGSTLEATALLRNELSAFFKEFDIKSILDIPCGDFNWMKEMNWSSIKYTGADIVKKMIDLNQSTFGNRQVDFLPLNILEDELPEADLIFCKDCWVHFSFEDIQHTLKNIFTTKATYLAVTTFPNVTQNKEIVTGEWRPLNLEKNPFHFPPPAQLLKETSLGDKCIGVWKIKDLRALGTN